ncbi:MAG: class B sortase [Bacilli bacterium]
MKKIIASILLVIAVVFLYKGIIDTKGNISNKIKNNSLRELTTSVASEPLDRIIDFEKLKAINEDIKAWIYVPGTNIDYPILVGESDEEYLYKDINKEYTQLGSLFGFAGTDFNKGNTFIFGHNMANNQMFGQLKKFISSEFSNENRYFYIYTERKVMKCEIFSTFICDIDDSIFNGEYELGTVDYVSLFSEIVNKNKYANYNLDKSILEYSKAQIFNLITCYGAEGTRDRLVVNGVVVEEKIK